MTKLAHSDILETIKMVDDQHLDVRTITMGISLLDCLSDNIDTVCRKIYDKITSKASNLVRTGEDIELEFGITNVFLLHQFHCWPILLPHRIA